MAKIIFLFSKATSFNILFYDNAISQLSIIVGNNSHLVVIDIQGKSDINVVINVYRSFNPQGNVTARDKFIYHLQLINNAMTNSY